MQSRGEKSITDLIITKEADRYMIRGYEIRSDHQSIKAYKLLETKTSMKYTKWGEINDLEALFEGKKESHNTRRNTEKTVDERTT